MSIQTSFITDQGIIIIKLSGRFVGKEAEDFIREVDNYVSGKENTKLIVDLSQLEYIGSQGASALVVLSEKYRAKITGLSNLVQSTLNLLKMDNILEIYDTLDNAINSFKDKN